MPPQQQPRQLPGSRPPKRKQPSWLWPAIAIAVVLLALVAVVVSRSGSDSSSPASVVAGAAGTVAPTLEQVRPVEGTGTPLVPLPDSGADPAVGVLAPELKGASFDGTPVSITHDGRPKLVMFAAHWCPHCQREVPLIQAHLKDHPLPSGIDLILVATGTNASAPNYPPSAWLAKVGWPSPIMADDAAGTAANAFGLPAYPFFVALDSQGRVVARTSGEIAVGDFDSLATKALAAT